MRTLFAAFIACVVVCVAAAADSVFVFIPESVPAGYVTGASRNAVTGQLVSGGLAQAPDNAWSGKIVVVDRGSNTVLDKINNVKTAGGIAVVFVNNASGTFTATLGTGNASTLTAVTVSQEDGARVKAKVGSAVSIGATAPPPPAFNLPSPVGNTGKVLASDGTNFAYIELAPMRQVLKQKIDIKVGAVLSFGVEGDGTPPFTFQWFKNGEPIAGKTLPVFDVASAQVSDSGRYTCSVTNAAGHATSQTVTVTVTP
jgi:hypothetical protein